MGQYTIKGLLNGYKKNNKERESLDWYATPPDEVENILNILQYDFNNKTILEPCVGGGHMAKGIDVYLSDKNYTAKKIATDIQDRDFRNIEWKTHYGLDFLADDYPYEKADIVIMNPPFATIEPFIIRALEIAQDKLIVFARTQIIEGVSRYNNIFKNNPPTYIYQYVDRIQCWKKGVPPVGSSAQAYCWIIWDKTKVNQEPILRWIRRK